jgi:DHA2 family multidrug resistance protein-like MFS transporter
MTAAPASARETIAGALSTSQHLPPAQAGELVHTAKDAFTSGVNVIGVIATVIFAGLAVLVTTMRARADRTVETPAAETVTVG